MAIDRIASQPAGSQKCEIVELEPGTHDGVLIVIDVVRAFTTAVAAFEAGAERIICVEDVERARNLRPSHPGALLMGEDRGLAPEGFDFGNSPGELDDLDPVGTTMIQRTSNGTRGLSWITAPVVLAASANNATATANFVRQNYPGLPVQLVVTFPTGEDRACAQFIAAVIQGRPASASKLQAEVLACAEAYAALWTRPREPGEVELFERDLERCALVDCADLAMVGERVGDGVELTPVRAGDDWLRPSSDSLV